MMRIDSIRARSDQIAVNESKRARKAVKFTSRREILPLANPGSTSFMLEESNQSGQMPTHCVSLPSDIGYRRGVPGIQTPRQTPMNSSVRTNRLQPHPPLGAPQAV